MSQTTLYSAAICISLNNGLAFLLENLGKAGAVLMEFGQRYEVGLMRPIEAAAMEDDEDGFVI